jgi:hypothetical protein
MSRAQITTPSTPTAPARKPSGFPLGWRRYRSYTLFAFTCIPMAISSVLLLQGVQPADLGSCLPCRLEGCERHVASKSRCLTELPPDSVIAAAEELLSRA